MVSIDNEPFGVALPLRTQMNHLWVVVRSVQNPQLSPLKLLPLPFVDLGPSPPDPEDLPAGIKPRP